MGLMGMVQKEQGSEVKGAANQATRQSGAQHFQNVRSEFSAIQDPQYSEGADGKQGG